MVQFVVRVLVAILGLTIRVCGSLSNACQSFLDKRTEAVRDAEIFAWYEADRLRQKEERLAKNRIRNAMYGGPDGDDGYLPTIQYTLVCKVCDKDALDGLSFCFSHWMEEQDAIDESLAVHFDAAIERMREIK